MSSWRDGRTYAANPTIARLLEIAGGDPARRVTDLVRRGVRAGLLRREGNDKTKSGRDLIALNPGRKPGRIPRVYPVTERGETRSDNSGNPVVNLDQHPLLRHPVTNPSYGTPATPPSEGASAAAEPAACAAGACQEGSTTSRKPERTRKGIPEDLLQAFPGWDVPASRTRFLLSRLSQALPDEADVGEEVLEAVRYARDASGLKDRPRALHALLREATARRCRVREVEAGWEARRRVEPERCDRCDDGLLRERGDSPRCCECPSGRKRARRQVEITEREREYERRKAEYAVPFAGASREGGLRRVFGATRKAAPAPTTVEDPLARELSPKEQRAFFGFLERKTGARAWDLVRLSQELLRGYRKEWEESRTPAPAAAAAPHEPAPSVASVYSLESGELVALAVHAPDIEE
ncbi:MAG TPA: hypothetical protein VKF62_03245, partial [Planctomycetota bacterium]|nr:hypothetical protein [Planctomycetota bacterium]